MSEELKEFYQTYHNWLLAGAPDNNPFWHDKGLCSCLYLWSGGYDDLNYEMQMQFREAGLSEEYPFDDGDWFKYDFAQRNGLLHLNAARIKWVKDHATQEDVQCQ
ncbi:hypothetical protein ORC68_000253 [Escherichia coli]|nr:hypothetical protein [Escherichia coli]